MATSGFFNTSGYEGRYLSFSWALVSQDTENNTSTISWSLRGSGTAPSDYYNAGNFKIIIDGVTVYQSATRIKLFNGTVVASGIYTINHNSNGQKTFEASCQASIYFTTLNATGSGSWSLPNISRYAVIYTVSNFKDTENPSLTFNNPNNYQLRFDLLADDTVIASRTVNNAVSPYVFNLTNSERQSLRAKAPDSNDLTVIYRLNTIISGSIVSTDNQAAVMEIEGASPILSGISYYDSNSDTLAITSDSSKIIEDHSILNIKINSIQAQKGATLENLEVKINNKTVSIPLIGTSEFNTVVIFGEVGSSISEKAYIKVTDSRGNETEDTIDINILSYALPYAVISCKREDNTSNNTDLLVNGFYSPLGGFNELSIEYQYKEVTSPLWSTPEAITSGDLEVLILDNSKAYDVKVILTDLLGSTTYIKRVNIGIPVIFFDPVKRSVGVNCFPTYSGSFEVNGSDRLFYHGSDTEEITGIVAAGVITNNSSKLTFSLPLSKSIDLVTASVNSLALTLIGGGSSVNINQVVGSSDYSIIVTPASDKVLSIEVTSTNGFSFGDNEIIGVFASSIISFTTT